KITEFANIDGIDFVRGGVVWVPDATGAFFVRAIALDATDTQIGYSERLVLIGANSPPTITIDGLQGNPSSPSSFSVFGPILTTADDPDGDAVTRVEFYNNGQLIGTDVEPPFGDELTDRFGEASFFELLR